jgi:hypothetical protein
MRPDVAFVYVRELVERMTGERPEPDPDGDLPVTYEGATFFVRIVGPVGTIEPWIQVFSVAVAEIEPTPELMVELNDINRDLRFARAFHVGTQVLIESEMWSDDLTPENFQAACRNVAGATDVFAHSIQEKFGGKLWFEASKTEEYAQGAKTAGVPPGPYL